MEETKHLVTARKWRPAKFDDLIGQDHVSQALKNSIKIDKIAHAFIFAGPRGIGKTSTARILAKSLNCPNPVDFNPCNTCDICLSITNGSNLDIVEIDGASNRKIDEVRSLRESVQFVPSMCKYKIYIIDEVHMLTTEAFNALLKTLEEPPKHVKFIFATTDIHKVPPTILSRCQRYDFRRLTSAEIISQLSKIAINENIIFDEDSLGLIAKKADGAMRDAQSLFDQVIVYSGGKIIYEDTADLLGIIDEDIYFVVSEAFLNKDSKIIFELIENVYFKGWELQTFLAGVIEHFRNILYLQSTNDTSLLQCSKSLRTKYVESTGLISSKDLLRILTFLHKSQYDLKQAANQKLALEVIMLQLISIPFSADLQRLINFIKNPDGLAKNFPINVDIPKIEDKVVSEPVIVGNYSKEVDGQKKPGNDLYSKPNSKKTAIKIKISPDSEEINLDHIKKNWEEFIEEMKSERMMAVLPLKNSFPLKYNDDILTIGVLNNSSLDALQKINKVICQKLEVFFGKKIGIEFCIDNSFEKQTNSPKNTAKTNSIPDKDLNDAEKYIISEMGGEEIT